MKGRKDCTLCEGTGEYESHHNGDYQSCDHNPDKALIPTLDDLLALVVKAGGQLKVSYTQPDPSKKAPPLHMGQVSVWLPGEALKSPLPEGFDIKEPEKGVRLSNDYALPPEEVVRSFLGAKVVARYQGQAVVRVYEAAWELLK